MKLNSKKLQDECKVIFVDKIKFWIFPIINITLIYILLKSIIILFKFPNNLDTIYKISDNESPDRLPNAKPQISQQIAMNIN